MTTHDADGIEIDHGDKDLSAAFRDGRVEVAIGVGYQGGIGCYEQYVDIILTIDEAKSLRDWLTFGLCLKELDMEKPNQLTITAMIADLKETAENCYARARRLHEPADNARLLEAAALTMTRAAEMLEQL